MWNCCCEFGGLFSVLFVISEDIFSAHTEGYSTDLLFSWRIYFLGGVESKSYGELIGEDRERGWRLSKERLYSLLINPSQIHKYSSICLFCTLTLEEYLK